MVTAYAAGARQLSVTPNLAGMARIAGLGLAGFALGADDGVDLVLAQGRRGGGSRSHWCWRRDGRNGCVGGRGGRRRRDRRGRDRVEVVQRR